MLKDLYNMALTWSPTKQMNRIYLAVAVMVLWAYFLGLCLSYTDSALLTLMAGCSMALIFWGEMQIIKTIYAAAMTIAKERGND